jgi:hypothetical protein
VIFFLSFSCISFCLSLTEWLSFSYVFPSVFILQSDYLFLMYFLLSFSFKVILSIFLVHFLLSFSYIVILFLSFSCISFCLSLTKRFSFYLSCVFSSVFLLHSDSLFLYISCISFCLSLTKRFSFYLSCVFPSVFLLLSDSLSIYLSKFFFSFLLFRVPGMSYWWGRLSTIDLLV